MEVAFTLFINGGASVGEPELISNLEYYREKLVASNCYEGEILIMVSSSIILHIEDSLPFLVKNLCFESLPKLKARTTILIDHFDHFGEISLIPEGDNIIISDSGSSSVSVVANELIAALSRCGERFINMLELMQKNVSDTRMATLLDFLRENSLKYAQIYNNGIEESKKS